MELSIYWTNFAKNELLKIYDYYKEKASIRIAKKLVTDIVKESQKLRKSPEIGQEETLLSDYSLPYRYLIFKNYKIVYMFDANCRSIEIHDVFDTRQNPIKINRKK